MTEEHSLEHRLLLAKASTHGKKFSATGGLHLTSDDVLIGSEYAAREKEKERLLKDKSRRQRLIAVEEKVQAIIEKKAMSINNNWTVGELNSVLSWHKVSKLDKMSTRSYRNGRISVEGVCSHERLISGQTMTRMR